MRRQVLVSPAPWLKIGRKSGLRNIYECFSPNLRVVIIQWQWRQ